MSDPYLILGIKPTATDEEVKKAYRDLVKKYHPDSYQNNPLSDLAEEKMKEVNEAYDVIVKQRAGGGYQGGGASYGGSSSQHSNDPTLAQVRRLLDSGKLNEAQQMLERSSARTAEWHYLMGGLAYRRGWLSDAQNYFAMACQMEPGNMEYRQAAMHLQTQAGRGQQAYRNTGGCSTSDLCSAFICYSCCCDGCG